MRPDLTQLRDLIEGSPGFGRGSAVAGSAAMIRAAETRVGPLPPSYRWWLAEFGGGRVGFADLATLPPTGGAAEPTHASDASDACDADGEEAYEAITAVWRLSGARLCFGVEPDGGDSYHFALDRTGEAGDGERPVVRQNGYDGDEHPVADSFAGFLAVEAARLRGLRDGPNPTIARLWRSTPGVLLDNGVLVHGPHRIQERNETLGVPRRAPEWVLIGEDGAGGGLFMRRHGRDRTRVHRLAPSRLGPAVEHIEAEGDPVTDDLLGWLRAGAPG